MLFRSVQVATRAGETVGLTYVGRGFDISIAAPLNQAGREALAKCAAECVEICPTGALSYQLRKALVPVSSGA